MTRNASNRRPPSLESRILRTGALVSLILVAVGIGLIAWSPFIVLHGPPITTGPTPAQDPTYLCWLTDEDGIITLCVLTEDLDGGETLRTFFSIQPLLLVVFGSLLPLFWLLATLGHLLARPRKQRRYTGRGFPVIGKTTPPEPGHE